MKFEYIPQNPDTGIPLKFQPAFAGLAHALHAPRTKSLSFNQIYRVSTASAVINLREPEYLRFKVSPEQREVSGERKSEFVFPLRIAGAGFPCEGRFFVGYRNEN